MLKKSMQKFMKAGKRIKCPVHENPNATSQWALRFYKLVECLKLQDDIHGVVWDWFDVPDNHHMHIDATLFAGDSCYRFEIDGETHFDSSGTQRSDADLRKDAILREYSVRLLRLHYRDADKWADYMQHFITWSQQGEVQNSVVYTGSYRDCLDSADAAHVLEF
jgi:hypothetical protein